MQWTANKVRQTYQEFFDGKQHQVVPSAPMVIKNDPTLMFTNAGMNQFKDIFLGNSDPKFPRVANSQKCLRVTGKHNDLDDVGVDTYHHTMFEMLGNWSFGDYFKEDAIKWGWELLTEVYGLDKDRLYVTIFGGDEADKLEEDAEARTIWANIVPQDRILACSKKDNFWEMGDTGPCGPCSEIHYDMRPEAERKSQNGRDLVNEDHPQVIEIWNLVFMEFNRLKDRSLHPLPARHVDTGMGFERLVRALQGKSSNYDTDVFMPLIKAIEKHTGSTYAGSDAPACVATRVVADHVRAIAFAIADSQMPGNTGAGYVIRRILRRAIRYAYSFLDMKEPFIYHLVAVLAKQMGEAFPELKAQQELIAKVVHEEEVSFLKTLEKGIDLFNDYMATKPTIVDGNFAFKLLDTFGFPYDLTELMAREQKVQIDKAAFDVALEKQRTDSRAATAIEAGDWVVLYDDEKEEFIGYDFLESTVRITRYREVTAKGKKQYQLVFNLTPFFAESGGQVGDTGYIQHGDEKISILDTQKENNVIIHMAAKLPSNPKEQFKAVVGARKRMLTANNHSATHLLHHALREVLGDHVEQKGSLVNDKHLRFDFSHFSKVTAEEIADVEARVNNMIRQNSPLDEQRSVPMEKALEMGAMALFGEKYGDVVRVIRFGESVELCGGIHVPATGQIGQIKIVHESAVAAGIRRIEAITAETAHAYMSEKLHTLEEVSQLLKSPADVKKAVADLIAQNRELTKQLESVNRDRAKGMKQELLDGGEIINGVKFIGQKVALDPDSIKDLAFQLKKAEDYIFLVLGAEVEGKANLTVAISDKLVAEKSMNAGTIIRDIAREIQGGGGGQAFFATAGGKDVSGIEKAIAKAKAMV